MVKFNLNTINLMFYISALMNVASCHLFLQQGVKNVQPYMLESKFQLLVG